MPPPQRRPGPELRHRWRRRAKGALAVLIGLAAAPRSVAAHQGQPSLWRASISLGANLSFGSTSHYVVTTRGEVARTDSKSEISAGAEYAYGEASDNAGRRFINRRSWRAEAAADFIPTSRVSPFVFGSVEASRQALIDRRWIGGAGAKLTFLRAEEVRVDFSTALMAMATDPLMADGSVGETVSDLRWSIRLRARRTRRTDRLRASARVAFQPVVSDWSRYLVGFETTVGLALTDRVTLDVQLVDRYDSEAESRGARSNHDGRLTFGLTTRF